MSARLDPLEQILRHVDVQADGCWRTAEASRQWRERQKESS